MIIQLTSQMIRIPPENQKTGCILGVGRGTFRHMEIMANILRQLVFKRLHQQATAYRHNTSDVTHSCCRRQPRVRLAAWRQSSVRCLAVIRAYGFLKTKATMYRLKNTSTHNRRCNIFQVIAQKRQTRLCLYTMSRMCHDGIPCVTSSAERARILD